MNQFRLFVLALLCSAFSLSARSQQTAAQVQADSIQRVLLHDSLGLTNSVVTQILGLRDSCTVHSAQVEASTSLTQIQKMTQVQNLRRDTVQAIKELMGSINYDRYLQLLAGR